MVSKRSDQSDDAVCTREITEMNVSIGIDVSKEKLDLGWLRDPATNKKKSKVFKNDPKHFESLVLWIIKNTKAEPQEILITLEPTGIYHEPLIYFLYDRGFNIYLANPAQAKNYAKSQGQVHKTDKLDAILLARFGLQQESRTLWQPEAPEIRSLKAMIRRLDALEKDRQRECNRLEASEFSDVSPRVQQSVKDMIVVLEEEIKRLQQDIDDHIDRYPPLKRNRELLETIKGVGPVISREMVCLLASKCFKTAKQLACYLGLIPQIKESGKYKGHSSLSKQGPGRLRAKLYMAAVVSTQHNPLIKEQYERLLGAGKKKMQALGAAMRKLAQICFGVVKSQQEFQPQMP